MAWILVFASGLKTAKRPQPDRTKTGKEKRGVRLTLAGPSQGREIANSTQGGTPENIYKFLSPKLKKLTVFIRTIFILAWQACLVVLVKIVGH